MSKCFVPKSPETIPNDSLSQFICGRTPVQLPVAPGKKSNCSVWRRHRLQLFAFNHLIIASGFFLFSVTQRESIHFRSFNLEEETSSPGDHDDRRTMWLRPSWTHHPIPSFSHVWWEQQWSASTPLLQQQTSPTSIPHIHRNNRINKCFLFPSSLDEFAQKNGNEKQANIRLGSASLIAEDEEKWLPPLGGWCTARAPADKTNCWEHLEEVVLHF